MKQKQTLYVIERKSQLAIYITEQLLELEQFERTDQVTAAIKLRDILLQRLGDMAIRLSDHTPQQAAVMIEMEPAAEPAPAVTEAEMAQADAYLEAHAGDMIQAQTDYNALLEQQERGITDEVGTKV